MSEPLQISDKAREAVRLEIEDFLRDQSENTANEFVPTGHFVQQLLDEETKRFETELQEAQNTNQSLIEECTRLHKELSKITTERDQLRQQLDIHAYEFKQLRDELECDGSDLSQLLAKIQLIRQQLTEAQAALNKIASWDEGPKVDSSFDEPGSAQIAREALTKAKELGL